MGRKIIRRQAYTGHFELDNLIERARLAAERDGKLRFVWGCKIHLKPERTGNYLVMGAEDWAAYNDGLRIAKEYAS